MHKLLSICGPPAAGKIYLILPFKFMDRKKLYQQGNSVIAGGAYEIPPSVGSIGKYDYVLTIGGKDYPCLAIAPDDEAFDERTWEIRFTPARPVVQMIFEIPVGTTKAELAQRIPNMFPEDRTRAEFPVGGDTNDTKKKGGR